MNDNKPTFINGMKRQWLRIPAKERFALVLTAAGLALTLFIAMVGWIGGSYAGEEAQIRWNSQYSVSTNHLKAAENLTRATADLVLATKVLAALRTNQIEIMVDHTAATVELVKATRVLVSNALETAKATAALADETKGIRATQGQQLTVMSEQKDAAEALATATRSLVTNALDTAKATATLADETGGIRATQGQQLTVMSEQKDAAEDLAAATRSLVTNALETAKATAALADETKGIQTIQKAQLVAMKSQADAARSTAIATVGILKEKTSEPAKARIRKLHSEIEDAVRNHGSTNAGFHRGRAYERMKHLALTFTEFRQELEPYIVWLKYENLKPTKNQNHDPSEHEKEIAKALRERLKKEYTNRFQLTSQESDFPLGASGADNPKVYDVFYADFYATLFGDAPR